MIILLLFGMVIALTGIAFADQVVPAVPEIQGVTSQVSIVCDGSVMNSGSLGGSLTSEDPLWDDGFATRDNPGWGGMLWETQVHYSTTYDANTIAQHGQTTFIKSMAVGTGNKLLTQSNVKALTESTYMATGDGGNILGTENIMIDGAGMPTMASDRILCPFGGTGDNVIPAYCTIATAGSRYDLVIGSVVSTADDRFVGTDATLPVVLNYGINVKPYTIAGEGTSPAMGSVSSSYKVSIKEGRTGYWGNITELGQEGRLIRYYNNGPNIYLVPPAWQQLHWFDVAYNSANDDMSDIEIGPQDEDVTYTESSSAAGIINSYNAAYQYQSGKVLLP